MTKAFACIAALAGGLSLAAASPALAWQNNGSYTGPTGGTVDWNQGYRAYGRACARSWSATTPGGQTYKGGATFRRTWYGGHVTNRWAHGPNGAYYGRRRR